MNKLVKSTDRCLGGVCGGLANYLNIDPTIVRFVWTCLTIFTACFPGIILYLILVAIMPDAPTDND